MYRLLIVDDDTEIVEVIIHFLQREGYEVVNVPSSKAALAWLAMESPDLFLLSTSLPEMDGLALCRQLRDDHRFMAIPILFMTGHPGYHAASEALEAGGDDYIRKPFAPRELVARIRAHLRRYSGVNRDPLPILRLQPDTMTICVNERSVPLTHVEFDLMMYLCGRPHYLHSTQDLLSDVWQYPMGAGDGALVRNHIRNLRRKLELDPDRPAIIQSRHGRGYSVRARVLVEDSHRAVASC
jgi:DNA-binding response OmpR family regulator